MAPRMRCLASLVLAAALITPAAAARTATAPKTIEQRHAEYAARTNRPPMTRKEQRRHGWKVLGARVLLGSGSMVGWALEKRSNQRGVNTQVDDIVTAGELRVMKLGMDRDEVGRTVQAQLDDLRAGRRTPGMPRYEVHVPENLLGVQ